MPKYKTETANPKETRRQAAQQCPYTDLRGGHSWNTVSTSDLKKDIIEMEKVQKVDWTISWK